MMDLYKYTYDLVKQIPNGKVSTYGAVAKALGDIRASRAVGRMMNQNPDPDTMPCFKIVYGDGSLGGFGLGLPDKIRRLKEDFIHVKNGKIVDFEQVFFDNFESSYPLKSCREKQLELKKQIILKNEIDESKIQTIAGFDVAYPKNDFDKACVSCVIVDYHSNEVIESKTIFSQTLFPYIPTYLTFRETPLIKKIFSKLENDPSVLMFDGNGILHPYQFGLACHAGLLLNKPSIGIAKSLLCGKEQKNKRIMFENKILGKAFYAHQRVKKPVYISPGHMISLTTSEKLVSKLSEYKHPTPLRQAHILATNTIKKKKNLC